MEATGVENKEKAGIELQTGTHAYYVPQEHKGNSREHFLDDSEPATVDDMVVTLNETLAQISEQGGKVINVLPLTQEEGNVLVSNVGVYSWIFIVDKT